MIVCMWISAVFLYLTYTTQSMQLLLVWLTLAGFFMSTAFGAFWALPMSTLSTAVTGRGMSIINTGGQIAGAAAPLMIGYLVQLSGGGFDTTFMFMIFGVLSVSMFASFVKTIKSVVSTDVQE